MKVIKQTSRLKKYGLSVGGTWGVWLILTAAIYVLTLGPQNALMARLQNEFVTSNEDYSLAQTAGRPETKAGMEKKLKDLSQKTAYFVVPPDNTPGLILQISQLAAKNQLQDFTTRMVSSYSNSKENDASNIVEVWLELEFTGGFTQMAAFINALERNDPVVFIENINLRRGTQANALPSATMQISYFTGKPELQKTESGNKP
jgi:Tfp pilus assembly protein PilO